MWWRVKPLLMGTAYYKTDSLIDRLLLSMTSSGTLSLYYFGQQIYGAGNGILVKAIVGPLVRVSAHFTRQQTPLHSGTHTGERYGRSAS
jgi:hypothetical protein